LTPSRHCGAVQINKAIKENKATPINNHSKYVTPLKIAIKPQKNQCGTSFVDANGGKYCLIFIF